MNPLIILDGMTRLMANEAIRNTPVRRGKGGKRVRFKKRKTKKR